MTDISISTPTPASADHQLHAAAAHGLRKSPDVTLTPRSFGHTAAATANGASKAAKMSDGYVFGSGSTSNSQNGGEDKSRQASGAGTETESESASPVGSAATKAAAVGPLGFKTGATDEGNGEAPAQVGDKRKATVDGEATLENGDSHGESGTGKAAINGESQTKKVKTDGADDAAPDTTSSVAPKTSASAANISAPLVLTEKEKEEAAAIAATAATAATIAITAAVAPTSGTANGDAGADTGDSSAKAAGTKKNVGRPRKDKKAVPTVGKTARKTRSQGPVDA